MRWRLFALAVCFLVMGAFSSEVRADKSSIKITAPQRVTVGTDATIRLDITHSGNNVFHYVDWVTVSVDGQEIKKWEYGGFDRPEDENFSLEFTHRFDRSVELTAIANCNLHGNTGPDTVMIQVEKGESQ